jgi:hypothetical protein
MLTFTFDTNCIIALENNEPAGPAIRALVDAHERSKANVAVVAISASEKQKERQQLRDFAEFRQRLTALGLGNLEILLPIFYYDVSFWDWGLEADDEAMLALERDIHEVLSPAAPFLWSDFCAANGLDPEASPLNTKWRNQKCDVLALWSHIYYARDVFVTNDGKFHALTKKPALIALGTGRIEKAEAAVTLI